MNHIEWDASYEIGVDFIDKEHKSLFSRMNKLLKLSESEEKSEWACREGVKYLKNHAEEHFQHEEAYMLSVRYSDFEIHRRLHDNFRHKTLPALEAELERSFYSTESIRHFVGVCIGWVVAHTKTEDLAIVGKGVSKWRDIPQEEKNALQIMIGRLVQELFHLNVKTVSEQYEGEDFGEMVSSRFLYRGQRGEKWEITLVFEERLLLKVIGEILNEKYARVDDMVLNINRYITRQFLEKVRENFPKLDLWELEKEALLTYEQLSKSYERTKQTYSLLFDTGEGYFAFSASAGDTARSKDVTEINYDSAMDSIRKYLVMEDAEQAARKPKILVVDDSDFMRTRMVKLLKPDYDVIEAESSIAAIKKIVVNRPGLILLDYEMPVCDGRQALEMIRSEKDIANIPVFFLTGRGDRESVRNVMSLKPEGYLLKTMTDDMIKKSIDDFFVNQEK